MTIEVAMILLIIGILMAYVIGNFVAEVLKSIFDPSIDEVDLNPDSYTALTFAAAEKEQQEGATWNDED